MSDVISQVLAKDPLAVLSARQAGTAAAPELARLVTHADAEVRTLAVDALNELGGPVALDAFATAVADANPQVRGSALRGLERHGRSAPAVIRTALDRARNGYARQRLLLLLAGAGGSLDEIRQRCNAEKDAVALEGCVGARAQLGDREAQDSFNERLKQSRNEERRKLLEMAEKIGGPWLFPALLPVLDDTTPMIRIGVDARPDLPDALRACDLAVRLVVRFSGHRFTFAQEMPPNFSPAQLEEVRNYIRKGR